MSTSDKSSSKSAAATNKKPTFFHRLNVRFPWLKLALVLIIGFIAILDLLDVTISKTMDLNRHFPKTPMAKHVKATERELKGKMLVALTFDDGQSSATTPTLLNILSEKNTLATFFMLGKMAENNPEIVKRAEREGHEIASHTMYHQNLIRISSSNAESDINQAKAVFRNILGHSPALTRPPYGNYNDTVGRIAGTPLIIWSVDPRDWDTKNAPAVLNAVLNQVHDGAIILLHDIYPSTVEAVPAIIDELRNRGYEFTTISELAGIRHVSLSPGQSYYNFRSE